MTGKRASWQTAAHRPAHRYTARRPQRRRPLGWRGGLAIIAGGVVLGLLGWAVLARHFAPISNTALTRFDVIIVLGTPADADGNPTPTQLARVNESVREYERGVAPRILMTGGAAHNQFVEAQVMARTAHAQGIPESAIFVEPQAKDTIQNACYAVRIMKAHGWHSAEVVSRGSHLARAGLIFDRLPLEWRTHTAPPLQPDSAARIAAVEVIETLKTVRYLVWTRQNERCEP